MPTIHHRMRREMVGMLHFTHPTTIRRQITPAFVRCFDVCPLLRRNNRVCTGPNVYLWVVTFS